MLFFRVANESIRIEKSIFLEIDKFRNSSFAVALIIHGMKFEIIESIFEVLIANHAEMFHRISMSTCETRLHAAHNSTAAILSLPTHTHIRPTNDYKLVVFNHFLRSRMKSCSSHFVWSACFSSASKVDNNLMWFVHAWTNICVSALIKRLEKTFVYVNRAKEKRTEKSFSIGESNKPIKFNFEISIYGSHLRRQNPSVRSTTNFNFD